jgi:hypothetical protein
MHPGWSLSIALVAVAGRKDLIVDRTDTPATAAGRAVEPSSAVTASAS